MKFIIISVILMTTLFSSDKKWESNKDCEACHSEISSKWEASRHSKSHFDSNDLFKKTLLYMVQEDSNLILNELKINCAKCHNPKITQKSVSQSDKFLLLMDLDGVKEEYDKVLNSKNMKNGINCTVCHNINKIDFNKTKGSTGMDSITFGPSGTMYGPFDDSVSPYHKTAQRKHFIDDDPKLCFACHFSGNNNNNVEVYSTGREYEEFIKDGQKSIEGCKSCHMSKKKVGVASNFSKVGERAKTRMVREHRFASVDNSDILKEYVEIKAYVKSGKFILNIKNNTPHNLPTGYGLREIILSVKYFDSSNRLIGKGKTTLGAKWSGSKGKYTIPHLATYKGKDTRLKGRSIKKYKFGIPKGVKRIKYKAHYKLIGDKMAKEIGITDPFFLKDYIFKEGKIDL
ncbi:MAG: multiheme c-type cytochrome [Sulfurovum sp.]